MRARILYLVCILVFSGLSHSRVMGQGKGYDVLYYRADLSLDRQHDSLSGKVTMTARATSLIDHVVQHAKFLSIDSILIATTRLQFTTPDSAGEYSVTLPNTIAPSVQFTISTYYHGKGMSEGGSFPWGGVTDSTGMLFAMGVGFTAPYISCTRHWMPCYDLPDDKADSVDLYFKVPFNEVVASNGTLEDVIQTHSLRTFHWHESHPIASYLLTFATAPFLKLDIQNSLGLPFEVYSFANDTLAVRMEMTNYVAPALAFFDSLFGKYPFEKVGYVLAPFGSMEHQTMITLDHNALNASSTIAQHELSHQWWGDRVTCKTFDDAWLNEGFATYCESLVLERFTGIQSYWTKQHSNIAGAIASGSSIAMYGAPNHTKPRNNYPYPIIYQKGASVLGMLRYFIGDSLFFHAIRTYGDRHVYSTATSFDLATDFQSATGQDLGWFFNKWVFGTGYPQLKVIAHHGSNDVSIAIQQVQDSIKYGFFRLPLIVEARKKGLTERVPIWLDSTSITQTQVHFSFSPDSIVVDPDGAVIKRLISTQLEVHSSASMSSPVIRVLSNPIRNDELDLEITAQKTLGLTHIFLTNELGTIIREIHRDSTTAKHLKLQSNLKGLASGLYYVMLQQDGGVFATAKFVVVH